ncbi:rolling circle replication-associated protein [Enterococcus durans]|uniref:rolling circle replication-associated protein n=1 Tax=Enterococcus durans TaxID=53345 RepID=UPI0011573A81|nr:hypothetical protein [Enterococcus durans]
MAEDYNAKIVRFGGHVEITRYGTNRSRAPTTETNQNIISKINDSEEAKKQRTLQQAYRIKHKIKYYCQANDFDLFWTLTFNDSKVNAKNYPYSKQKLQAWLKYQREKYGKFGYLFIPELHKSGRVHFHGVTESFAPPLVEARYPKNNRLIKKNGIQIYNAETWKNGFSTVSKIENKEKSANYITKYITKELINTPSAYHQPRYFVSRGLRKPDISYAELPNDYFEDFVPSFVVGGLNTENNQFQSDVSIYKIDISENGELLQNSPPKTFWKLKQPKSPEGNQDSK